MTNILNPSAPTTIPKLITKKNLHILIAEDDNEDVALFRDALDEIARDIKVSEVSNGLELMEFLHNAVPDVIFLNIRMHCQTGIECLTEIRKLNRLSKIPIVIYSTGITAKQVDKIYNLGANLYFEKPSSYVGMMDGLTKILSHTTHTLFEVSRDE